MLKFDVNSPNNNRKLDNTTKMLVEFKNNKTNSTIQ